MSEQEESIHLDGRTLEGGGQLLRLALSLSCLTGRAIHVTDIRGNRTRRKGRMIVQGGGMKGSHLECAKWLARATNAETQGMAVGSSTLVFRPRLDELVEIDAVLDSGPTELQVQDQIAQATDDSGASRSGVKPRYLTIKQKTPGSVYLIVQALLPYLLFGPFCSPRKGEKGVPVVHLRVIGGTNVGSSPSHEYATQVLFPTLTEHLGIAPIRTTLIRRGWSSPDKSGTSLGEVLFEITPVAASAPLPAFSFVGDGTRHQLVGLDVSILANPPDLLRELAQCLPAELKSQCPTGVPIRVVLEEDSGLRSRIQVLVVAKVAEVNADGSHGKIYRLATDELPGQTKASRGKGQGKTIAYLIARSMAREVIKKKLWGGSGLVDEHMLDQLVVFQALSAGRSEVAGLYEEPSLHALTARWVAEQMLEGLSFEDGACDGINFFPGVRLSDQKAASTAAEFDKLALEEKG